MSYSNRIDPDTPWCLFEATGGQCNDRDCPNQHIKDMILAGS